MKLEINGTRIAEPLTRQVIEDAVRGLDGDGDSFAILSLTDMHYMQTCGGPGNYVLEYQAGSLDQHFTCTKNPVSADDVVRAFLSYFETDGRWESDFDWKPEEFAAAAPGLGARVLLIVGLLVAGAVLVNMLAAN